MIQNERAIAVIAFAIIIAACIIAAGSAEYCDYRVSKVLEKCNEALSTCNAVSYNYSGIYGNVFNDTTRTR